jgi:SNF2 family DNA or RNA helicase
MKVYLPFFAVDLPLTLNVAHTIRNRATAMARAACAIHATNRWAITGTPIQNRVTDFASLLEFLQVYPFSNPKVFDTEITKPWLKSGDRDVSRLKKLVNCISLCRTKAVIELPRRVDLIRNLDFSPEEQSFYDRAKDGTIRKFDEAMASNPVPTGQYLNALQWLNELRLVCNHGLLHSKRDGNKSLAITPQNTQTWNKSTANKAFETIVSAGEAICSVCGNVLIDGSSSDSPKPFLSKCLTLSCGSCIKDTPSGQPNPTCLHTPLCKSVEVSWLSEHVTKTTIEKSLPKVAPEQVSTKLRALMDSLKSSPESEKRHARRHYLSCFTTDISRSVVFSYWTYTLDLIESLLKEASISYTRIDGQYSGEKRESAIRKFQTDETIQVILVSITCGGAGYAIVPLNYLANITNTFAPVSTSLRPLLHTFSNLSGIL